jgi:competence protein ComEC
MKGQVVMIDVGQGDCFFIQQPYARGNVLIDTGGLQKSDLATSRLIPYLQSQGVFYLDAVFISHEDYDHCGALASLKEHFKVKKVLYDFKKKKIGDLVFKNLALDKYYTNSNDRSSIIYVTINHLNYLFTGDISKEVESDLYQTYHHLDVDVLKVAHHGSSSSSSEDLFKMIDPKVALISVGKNNRYRHPSYLTLKRLEAYGVKIYRSDLQGMVKIVYYVGKNYVMTSSGF